MPYSTTYLPCHLLPVGGAHLLGLIPGEKNIHTTYMFYAYLLQVKLDYGQYPSELYSQNMQTSISHLDEENVALGYPNTSPPNHLATKDRI